MASQGASMAGQSSESSQGREGEGGWKSVKISGAAKSIRGSVNVNRGGVKNPGRERQGSGDDKRKEGDKGRQQSVDNQSKNKKDEELGQRKYRKEYTIEVTIPSNNQDIDADDIMDEVQVMCGKGILLACVPCGQNVYQLTLVNNEYTNVLKTGFSVEGVDLNVTPLQENSTVVSIMFLPAYIPDFAIIKKLEGYGLEILSPVRRRYYERDDVWIADGTRYVRAKFPEGMSSLPYAIKFDNIGDYKYYRVLHNGQIKVCNNCLSPDHMAKSCPKTKCFVCKNFGHIARACPSKDTNKDRAGSAENDGKADTHKNGDSGNHRPNQKENWLTLKEIDAGSGDERLGNLDYFGQNLDTEEEPEQETVTEPTWGHFFHGVINSDQNHEKDGQKAAEEQETTDNDAHEAIDPASKKQVTNETQEDEMNGELVKNLKNNRNDKTVVDEITKMTDGATERPTSREENQSDEANIQSQTKDKAKNTIQEQTDKTCDTKRKTNNEVEHKSDNSQKITQTDKKSQDIDETNDMETETSNTSKKRGAPEMIDKDGGKPKKANTNKKKNKKAK